MLAGVAVPIWVNQLICRDSHLYVAWTDAETGAFNDYLQTLQPFDRSCVEQEKSTRQKAAASQLSSVVDVHIDVGELLGDQGWHSPVTSNHTSPSVAQAQEEEAREEEARQIQLQGLLAAQHAQEEETARQAALARQVQMQELLAAEEAERLAAEKREARLLEAELQAREDDRAKQVWLEAAQQETRAIEQRAKAEQEASDAEARRKLDAIQREQSQILREQEVKRAEAEAVRLQLQAIKVEHLESQQSTLEQKTADRRAAIFTRVTAHEQEARQMQEKEELALIAEVEAAELAKETARLREEQRMLESVKAIAPSPSQGLLNQMFESHRAEKQQAAADAAGPITLPESAEQQQAAWDKQQRLEAEELQRTQLLSSRHLQTTLKAEQDREARLQAATEIQSTRAALLRHTSLEDAQRLEKRQATIMRQKDQAMKLQEAAEARTNASRAARLQFSAGVRPASSLAASREHANQPEFVDDPPGIRAGVSRASALELTNQPSASRRRQSVDEPNAHQPVDDEASQKVQWADELRAATSGQQAPSPGLQQIVQVQLLS